MDPPGSGTDDLSSDESRPPRQDAGPSSGGLSHGAAGANPSPPSTSEKSVAVEAVSDDEQHDAASESAPAEAAEGHDPARAGVGRRGYPLLAVGAAGPLMARGSGRGVAAPRPEEEEVVELTDARGL